MSSVQALDLAPEIWLKIAVHFGSDVVYFFGGLAIVGPLPSSAPPKDLVNLSCVCRFLRSTLGNDIKAFLHLHMGRQDKKFVYYQSGSNFPQRDDRKEDAAEIHELPTLPLGGHIRHLRVCLRDPEFETAFMVARSRDYTDKVVSILTQTPCLQYLDICARFGINFTLPPDFYQALSGLKDLRTLVLRGIPIPANCPTLRNVERIQTNAIIHSFECLPQLRDLRQIPYMFTGYNIPSDVLTRLEVLHYCSLDNIDQSALLPKVCQEMKNAPSKGTSALRELVFNGYPSHTELLDILYGLASPYLRTFVSFGLFRGGDADYNELMGIIRKVFPKLTTLDFRKTLS